MERSQSDRLLEAVGAQFEAAIAAEEDAAASDLALSLLQGSELSVLLCRSPWLLRRFGGGGNVPLTQVGPDCALATGRGSAPDVLVPLSAAVFVAGEGPPPVRSPDTFVALLRQRVRVGKELRVLVGDEVFQGRARLVTDTHLVLARSHGEAIVPLSEVREVQLSG